MVAEYNNFEMNCAQSLPGNRFVFRGLGDGEGLGEICGVGVMVGLGVGVGSGVAVGMGVREGNRVGVGVAVGVGLGSGVGQLLNRMTAKTGRLLNHNARKREPDYCKLRLLEIEVGRRFWQSTASPKEFLQASR